MIRIIVDISESQAAPGRCNIACEAREHQHTPVEAAACDRFIELLRAEGQRILKSYSEVGKDGKMLERDGRASYRREG